VLDTDYATDGEALIAGAIRIRRRRRSAASSAPRICFRRPVLCCSPETGISCWPRKWKYWAVCVFDDGS